MPLRAGLSWMEASPRRSKPVDQIWTPSASIRRRSFVGDRFRVFVFRSAGDSAGGRGVAAGVSGFSTGGSLLVPGEGGRSGGGRCGRAVHGVVELFELGLPWPCPG
jgi:hypothetical protein